MSSNSSPHSAPGVHRAIDVMEFVASAQREVALSELLDSPDIPRQSLIRILNTLCERGVLDKSSQRGFYRIGVKFLYLGHGLPGKFELRKTAWDEMKALSRKTKKTIELSSLDRDQLILLEQMPSTEDMTHYSRAGSVIPYLYTVSVGKLYLAQMDAAKRQRVLGKIGLPAMTRYTITDMDRYGRMVREAADKASRALGYKPKEKILCRSRKCLNSKIKPSL